MSYNIICVANGEPSSFIVLSLMSEYIVAYWRVSWSVWSNWRTMADAYAVGTHSWAHCWKRGWRRDSSPGGPNDTKGKIITNRKPQIVYPCYCIKDTQSLKDR